MKTFDDICEHYAELEDRLRAFSTIDFSVEPCGQGVEIDVPGAISRLRLGKKQLEALENGDLINDVRKLKYHQDTGISFETYSEFFITIEHPQYLFLDLTCEWPGSVPLRFKIGDISIVSGLASPLIVLLMEPHFMDSDIHHAGFNYFASVRLLGADHQIAASYLHKALYYMNSHYLKSVGLVVALRHLNPGFEDPLGLYSGIREPKEAFKKIVRRRVRKRNDFFSTEPLLLYNHACQSSGNESFLSFYRVLEFFFTRGILANIDALRNDPLASAQDILDIATAINEEQQLRSLVSRILTASQKKKLFEYAHWQSLIDKASLSAFVGGLYSFRNSLVHAKEAHLQKTTLPDPFSELSHTQNWTYIVAVCAERAIRILNSK
ncbi:MAG: hypothetical protein ABIF87_12575 [Pseudomonadota bacterium]